MSDGKLKHKLSMTVREMFPVKDDSESHVGFMQYGVICQHDTGYMCKCRAEYVGKVIEETLNKLLGK